MITDIRFLHTMRKPEYLEQALRHGLMLTDHEATFRPFDDDADAARLTGEILLPRLTARLKAIGECEVNLNALVAGIGSISGQVPMICFTEVHDGRDLSNHFFTFGAYGVVVNRQWLEANGGDRVLYAGPQSRVTKLLHKLFVEHQLSGLHSRSGKAMYSSETLSPILDLLAYVETRAHLEEVEWRIAGEHGFTGRKRASGERIQLPLSAIEMVLVQNNADVEYFTSVLKSLPDAASVPMLPAVKVYAALLGVL